MNKSQQECIVKFAELEEVTLSEAKAMCVDVEEQAECSDVGIIGVIFIVALLGFLFYKMFTE
jgi:hypothetical protein